MYLFKTNHSNDNTSVQSSTIISNTLIIPPMFYDIVNEIVYMVYKILTIIN